MKTANKKQTESATDKAGVSFNLFVLGSAVKEGSVIKKGTYQYTVEIINGELSIRTVHYGSHKLKNCKHYKIVSV